MAELALKYDPSNRDFRFKVAYRYEEQDAPNLSLQHYQRVLNIKPEDKTSLNNAGVAAESLELQITSIDFYKKSRELGGTLAASNMAYRLIEAGFSEEAKEILHEAQEEEEVDPNVPQALGRLATHRQSESDYLAELKKNAEKARTWRLRYAEARLADTPPAEKVSGSYTGTLESLEISIDSDGNVEGTFKEAWIFPEKTISGKMEGCGISISWFVENKSEEISAQGHGYLVWEDNQIIGYTLNGKRSLDVQDLDGWIEWSLERK